MDEALLADYAEDVTRLIERQTDFLKRMVRKEFDEAQFVEISLNFHKNQKLLAEELIASQKA